MMSKNIQLKIMLIYFIIGILLISGIGGYFLTQLYQLNDIKNVNDIILEAKEIIIISMIVFSLVTLAVCIIGLKIV